MLELPRSDLDPKMEDIRSRRIIRRGNDRSREQL